MKSTPAVSPYYSDLFSINVVPSETSTKITMQVFDGITHTDHLPATFQILKQFLPTIFRHRCFNYGNYSFAQEVKNTEVGHLFEHILLEYLCKYKSEKHGGRVNIKGVTDWNWIEDDEGTFHIKINCAIDDVQLFQKALKNTIELTQIILLSPLNNPENVYTLNSASIDN